MDENIINEFSTEEDAGIVRISDEVVGVIASNAAVEIEGVSGVSTGIVEDLSKKFTGKKSGTKGVRITMDNGSAIIDLHMSVEYGRKIPEVSLKVQNNVKTVVETMTGLSVSAVNVYIQNIVFPKQKKEDAE